MVLIFLGNLDQHTSNLQLCFHVQDSLTLDLLFKWTNLCICVSWHCKTHKFCKGTDVKGNREWFYKDINSKRRAKENLPPLLGTGGNIVTKGEEKAEIISLALQMSQRVSTAEGIQSSDHPCGLLQNHPSRSLHRPREGPIRSFFYWVFPH